MTEGSAIRRIGHLRWLRNIAVMGNAPWEEATIQALEQRLGEHPLLDEHIQWAIAQQKRSETPAALRCRCRNSSGWSGVVEKGLPRDA